MLPRPRLVLGVGNVVGGRQPPAASGVHQEPEVLHVVVEVYGRHVEDHSPVGLVYRLLPQTEGADGIEVAFVAEHVLVVEVDVLKPAEAVEVESGLACLSCHTVEAAGHEVSEVAISQKVGLGHADARLRRHARVCVFDAAPGAGLPITPHALSRRVPRHPIELDEPGLVAGVGTSESRADAVGRSIPENERLRTGTARAAPDLHDLRNRHRHVSFDDAPRLIDQGTQLKGFFRARPRIKRRMELKGSHRPAPDVEESLKRGQGVARAPAIREVAANNGVAESVRQSVGEDAWKAEKGRLPGKLRKRDGTASPDRQVERRDVEPGSAKVRIVFEGHAATRRLSQIADVPPPKSDPHNRIVSHGPVSKPAGAPCPGVERFRRGTLRAQERMPRRTAGARGLA